MTERCGRCIGGPYNGREQRHNGKCITVMLKPGEYSFMDCSSGEYHWDETDERWLWVDAEEW